MKTPDFVPERWAIYGVAAIVYLVTTLGLDVTDTQKFWGGVVIFTAGILGEAYASARTRAARAAALPALGMNVPASDPRARRTNVIPGA